jgi:hypothetical protein
VLIRAWGAGSIFLAVKGFVVDVKELRRSGEGVGSWFLFLFLCFVREMMAENSGSREQDHERIRTVCAQVPLIDAHAHNVVGLDSNLPFLVCLREARGLDAVRQSLAFQVLPLLLLLFFFFPCNTYLCGLFLRSHQAGFYFLN